MNAEVIEWFKWRYSERYRRLQTIRFIRKNRPFFKMFLSQSKGIIESYKIPESDFLNGTKK